MIHYRGTPRELRALELYVKLMRAAEGLAGDSSRQGRGATEHLLT